jgi:hypothetical protein
MVIALKKKISYSVIFLLMAVLLVSYLGFMNLVSAQKVYFNPTIDAPVNGSTFNSNSISVNVTIEYPEMLELITLSNAVYLDGGYDCSITFSPTTAVNQTTYKSVGSVTMHNLTEGTHTLQIKGSGYVKFHWPTGQPWSHLPVPYTANENFKTEPITFYINLEQHTATPQPTQNSFSDLSMITAGIIVGTIISVALLVIYRKQNLKRNNKPNIS